MAENEGKPVGKPLDYDAFHYEHQIPGGMQATSILSSSRPGFPIDP